MRVEGSSQGLETTDIESDGVRLRIILPPPDLAPFVSSYYSTQAAPGPRGTDWLPPESANLRAGRASIYEAAIGDEPMRAVPAAVISGPTSKATRLRIEGGHFWGVGLSPAGFAKFVGLSAADFADRFVDMTELTAFEGFVAMFERMMENPGDTEGCVASLNQTFRALLDRPLGNQDAIVKAHGAIVSDETNSVAQLGELLNFNSRTLERFCRRYFGFNPQMLLRRQRFLRSLAKFMLDPSMKWIDSLDTHYCDQAHFGKDFKNIMGMRPSDFARMNHPIASAAVHGRTAIAGEGMQALAKPGPAGSGDSGL